MQDTDALIELTTNQSTDLIVMPPASLPTVMAAPGASDILSKLVEELAGYKGDPTTEKGRKDIASKSRKAAVAKMDLIRLADTLKEGAQKTIKGVNAEVKIITERMDALRDQIRAPLDEFEAIEEARVKAHHEGCAEIESWATVPADWSAEQIADRLAELSSHALLGRDWQEFKGRAQQAATDSFNALKVAHAEVVQHEAAAAEAERLHAEEAERQRLEAERLQAERESEIARQAAENARLEAERIAAKQAAEAERAAQAERDWIAAKAQAAADAAEAERQRIVRAAEEQRLAAERLATAQMERIQRAEREKEEATQKAEADRLAAEGRAEQQRLDAVEAERHRQEQEAARIAEETCKREANVAHKRKINREAVADLVTAGLTEEQGILVVTALATRAVRHCQISY